MKPFAAKGFIVLCAVYCDVALCLAYTCQMIIAMINQDEVPDYISAVIPDIAMECYQPGNVRNIYRSVHVFLDYTFRMIREHNMAAVNACFTLAEKLYTQGSSKVKCAIENVFVFSFSLLPVESVEERSQIMNMIPAPLISVYMGQVLHEGC